MTVALRHIRGVPRDPHRGIFEIALGAVMVSFSNYTYEPSLGTRKAAGKAPNWGRPCV